MGTFREAATAEEKEFCQPQHRLTTCTRSEIMALRGIEVGHDRGAKQINGQDWKAKLLAVMD